MSLNFLDMIQDRQGLVLRVIGCDCDRGCDFFCDWDGI